MSNERDANHGQKVIKNDWTFNVPGSVNSLVIAQNTFACDLLCHLFFFHHCDNENNWKQELLQVPPGP